MSNNRSIYILAAVLLAAVIATYANHFQNTFHFDDSHEYGEYVPDTCTFILVPKTNFQKMFDLADMM